MKRFSKHISFLIGAGFSKPAGYPLAKEINEKFRDLAIEEFCIHTSGKAWLTEKQEPNWILTKEEHYFVIDFLKFYTEEVISNKNEFHYETFFDYYMQLLTKSGLNEKEEVFFKKFRKERNYNWDHYNLLNQFNRTFQQLVANFINIEWPKSGDVSMPYTDSFPHKKFLELLKTLGERFQIHLHTLNHDLLMEKYFHYEPLVGEISDGFNDFASPYYGLISNDGHTQRIRLKRFVNKYDEKYNLYKLHGSVDNYIFNTNNKKYEMIKWEYGLLERGIVKEITSHLGEKMYFDGYMDTVPEFLSGTTEKIKHYERKVYYSQVFERFLENLKNSNILISIGYGFGDLKINQYISDYFLSESTKTLLIINASRPEADIVEKENVIFYKSKVEEINLDKVREKIAL